MGLRTDTSKHFTYGHTANALPVLAQITKLDMSKKRVADKQLTDQNWLDEEEPEEAGEFKRADDDAIKKRV